MKVTVFTFAYDIQIQTEINPKQIKLNQTVHTHSMKYSDESRAAVQSRYSGVDSSVLI